VTHPAFAPPAYRAHTHYLREPSVHAVQVTLDNMDDVAAWCGWTATTLYPTANPPGSGFETLDEPTRVLLGPADDTGERSWAWVRQVVVRDAAGQFSVQEAELFVKIYEVPS
jgi:hypothetical protein